MTNNWEYLAGTNMKVVMRKIAARFLVPAIIEYRVLKVCDCCGTQEFLWNNMITCEG